jgi:hypothetical protein
VAATALPPSPPCPRSCAASGGAGYNWSLSPPTRQQHKDRPATRKFSTPPKAGERRQTSQRNPNVATLVVALPPNYDSCARRHDARARRRCAVRQTVQHRWTIHLGSTRTVPRARVINKEKSAQSGDRTLAKATFEALRSTRPYQEIGLWPKVELSEEAIKALVEAIHEIQVSDTDEQQT